MPGVAKDWNLTYNHTNLFSSKHISSGSMAAERILLSLEHIQMDVWFRTPVLSLRYVEYGGLVTNVCI